VNTDVVMVAYVSRQLIYIAIEHGLCNFTSGVITIPHHKKAEPCVNWTDGQMIIYK